MREDDARSGGERPKPGRPKVVEGTVSPTTVYLTEELRARMDASRGRRSMSQWIRDAIEEKLARGGSPGGSPGDSRGDSRAPLAEEEDRDR